MRNEHGDQVRDGEPDPDVINELDYWAELRQEENPQSGQRYHIVCAVQQGLVAP